MDKEKNRFLVLEAFTRDVGSGVIRIEKTSMEELCLSSGDIVEIKGKRRTFAKCMRMLSADELEAESKQLAQAREKLQKTQITENNVPQTNVDWGTTNNRIHMMIGPVRSIRIDGLIRNNAGTAIGDTVTIRKVNLPQAETVSIMPLENIPPIDERYLADALDSIPITKGDNVMIPYFGGRLTFQVNEITPNSEAVIVSQKTIFSITDRGPILQTVGDFKYYTDPQRISCIIEDTVRKESEENHYLILKINLYKRGFGSSGEFQIKLDKSITIQQIISRYKGRALELVEAANSKLVSSNDINPVDLLQDLKFAILERWRTMN